MLVSTISVIDQAKNERIALESSKEVLEHLVHQVGREPPVLLDPLLLGLDSKVLPTNDDSNVMVTKEVSVGKGSH